MEGGPTAGLRPPGLVIGFWVQGSEFEVQGSGFRALSVHRIFGFGLRI